MKCILARISKRTALIVGILFFMTQLQAGVISAAEEPATQPAPSPQEVLKTLDDSIAKIEESIKLFDAQIAEADATDTSADAWGVEHAESIKNDLKKTAVTYKPLLEEQLKNLKAMRQQAASKLGRQKTVFRVPEIREESQIILFPVNFNGSGALTG
jgi:hypothetical protein